MNAFLSGDISGLKDLDEKGGYVGTPFDTYVSHLNE